MGNGDNKNSKNTKNFSENAPTEKEHLYVQCKTQKYIGRKIEVDADTILKWKKNFAVYTSLLQQECLDSRFLHDSNLALPP